MMVLVEGVASKQPGLTPVAVEFMLECVAERLHATTTPQGQRGVGAGTLTRLQLRARLQPLKSQESEQDVDACEERRRLKVDS